jgi:hypothetical protein
LKTSELELKVEGGGITPSGLDVADLATLLVGYKKAILAQAAHDGLPTDIDVVLALKTLQEGSVRVVLEMPRFYDSPVKKISQAIADRDQSRICEDARFRLADATAPFIKRGYSVRFPADCNALPAVVSADSPILKPDAFEVTSATTLYGKVQRVGGAKPSARLQLGDGRFVPIVTDASMMEELGKVIWKDVAVSGDATVNMGTGEIVKIRVKGFEVFSPGDIADSLAELARVVGEQWDPDAADEYLRELRSDE